MINILAWCDFVTVNIDQGDKNLIRAEGQIFLYLSFNI